MTLAVLENALREEARAWAIAEGLQFAWDNSATRDPDKARSLVWSFSPEDRSSISSAVVRHEGAAVGRVLTEAGSGIAGLSLAVSLRDALAGKVVGPGEVLPQVEIRSTGRDGPSQAIEVAFRWRVDIDRVPQGVVGANVRATELSGYQAARARWESRVRLPLGLPTFWPESPPKPADAPPPWAICSWRTFRPVQLDGATQRVAGRLLVGMAHGLGVGVQAANLATETIVSAYHECSFGGLFFGTAEVVRVGRNKADIWQTNVRLPFYYDQRI